MTVKQEIKDLKGIAAVYRRRGRHKLAADVLNTVLELETHAYGPESLEVAVTKYELAEVLCKLKHYEKGRALMAEAARIWSKHQPTTGHTLRFANALEKLQGYGADLFKQDSDSGDGQAA